MLKNTLIFIIILLLITGITESLAAGFFIALLAIITRHFLLVKKQSPNADAFKESQVNRPRNEQGLSLDLSSASSDYSAQSSTADTASLESRVNALEQQVSQLKKQLLEVLSKSAITAPSSLAAEVKDGTNSTNRMTVAAISTPPSDAYFDVSTNPILETVNQQKNSLNQHLQKTDETAKAYEPYAPPNTPPTQISKPYSAPSPTQSYQPSILTKLTSGFIKASKDWLIGGNTLVRVGIIILFFGVAFLLKYAAENDYIPIEMRLLAVAVLGMGLVGIGFRARNTVGKTGFSFAMQGGGVGVLYLTIFSAFKLYHLIPQGLSFGLLAGVAFASAGLAVLQSALALAILGFAGGFLAPILISTGGGSHVGLFSYYLVLNLGIAFVAYFRGWRVLNVMGFAFTFLIGTLWGVQKYIPELFPTTEPFLIAHGLIYTFVAIVYAFKRAPSAKDYVDATLVFGTPLVGFGLQYGLLKDSPMGMAYSALALGGYYMMLAWWILTRQRATLKFLGECFLALAVGFATLAIPLSLDGRWTSASWALEGVALLWVGLKQARFLPSATGLALQVLGAFMFIKGWGLTGSHGTEGQNMFLGAAFIALSGLSCGALLLRHSRNEVAANAVNAISATLTSTIVDASQGGAYTPPTLAQRLFEKVSELASILSILAAAWGWAWLMLSGAKGISAWIGDEKPFSAVLNLFMLFVVLAGLALYAVARKLSWPALRSLSFTALPALVGMAVWTAFQTMNVFHAPSAFLGWLCWPVAVVAYWLMLRWDNTAPTEMQHDLSQTLGISATWLWQSPLLWLVCGLGLLELNFFLENNTHLMMSITYAAEGAAMVWLGLRSTRWLPKAVVNPWVMVLAGLGLQVVAGLRYLIFSGDFSHNTYSQAAIIGSWVGLSAYLIRHLHPKLSTFFTMGAWLAWMTAGVLLTEHLYELTYYETGNLIDMHWFLAYAALLSIAVYWLGRRLQWGALWRLSFAVLPLIGLGVLIEGLSHTPLAEHGWLGWPALLVTLPLLLHWQGKLVSANVANTDSRAAATPWRFATGWMWRAPWLWALAWLTMRQAFDFTAQHAAGDWPVLAGLAASFIVVMVTLWVNAKSSADYNSCQRLNWLVMGCGPVIACLLTYSVYATLNLAGDTPPLPYISLLNPLELGLLGILILSGLWFKSVQSLNSAHPTTGKGKLLFDLLPHASKLLALMGFVWLNSVLLRSLHHYIDVPYLWGSVLHSTVARAAFTLLWSLTALALMLYAHKKAARTLWIIGAVLMGVVVAKLFLLDLSGRGTVERIVSFMGAGILMLVMGYLAPLPPAQKNAAKTP
jgi:uncharacterized membrane protein